MKPLKKDHQFNFELLYNLFRTIRLPFQEHLNEAKGTEESRLCAPSSSHFKQVLYPNEQKVKWSFKNKGLSCEDQAGDKKILPPSTGGDWNINRLTGYNHTGRQCLHSKDRDPLLGASHSRDRTALPYSSRRMIVFCKINQQKSYPPLLLHMLLHVHIKPQASCLTSCNLGYIYSWEQKVSSQPFQTKMIP